MAITCVERPRQASESHYLRPGGTREYIISGTTSKLSAQLCAVQNIPQTDTGLSVDSTTGTEVALFLEHIAIKEEGGGVWSAVARYESSSDVTDLQFTFGTVTTKIFQALRHIRSYDCKNGGIDTDDIPLHNGVIGVNGDEVEGVDVEASDIQFVITKKRFRSTLPADYFQILVEIMDMRTPVNNNASVVRGSITEANNAAPPALEAPIMDDGNLLNAGGVGPGGDAGGPAPAADTRSYPFVFFWKGLRLEFPEGSLRLRGIPVKWTGMNEVEISYMFHYSRPITLLDNFTIGSSDPIQKEGHEYGWISYKLETSNGATIRIPESFNVEQVYPKRDFTVLDL